MIELDWDMFPSFVSKNGKVVVGVFRTKELRFSFSSSLIFSKGISFPIMFII